MRIPTMRFSPLLILAALALCVSACTTPRQASGTSNPSYKVGKPYQVNGRWYHPKEEPNYEAVGAASWYGPGFHGKMTANGEIFDENLLSAAHTTLPMPSMVEVTNLGNGKKIVVRVNDRGPFARDRIIDLSREAARRLGFEHQGTTKVKAKYLGPAPLNAKAPRQEPKIAKATPVTPASATRKPNDEASDILAAMEDAPAMTRGAETYAVAESRSNAKGPAPVAAADISTSNREDVRIVDASPAASGKPIEALYVVRVAALSRLDNIDGLKAQLEPVGPLRVSRVELDDRRVVYRINMGPFASIETAAERLEAVRAAGYDDAALVALTP